jgi:hypothetical protein
MKMIDKFLAKVGTDKALHFLVGALITAYASMLGVHYVWASIPFVVFLSFYKEFMDKDFDIKDIIAGVLGSVTSVVVYWVLQLILLV